MILDMCVIYFAAPTNMTLSGSDLKVSVYIDGAFSVADILCY